MVSVDGLLDAHEVAVRARVEELRERAAQVAIELGEAEKALEHVAITRATLAAVIAGDEVLDGLRAQGTDAPVPDAPGPGLVPVWRAGSGVEHLPAGYRAVWRAVIGAPGPVRAKELAVAIGLESSVGKVEGLRAKLKRLSARGWITEPAPGVFAPVSTAPVSPVGGS